MLYDKPLHQLMKAEMIPALGLEGSKTFSLQDAQTWVQQNYPKFKASTVSMHLRRLSTNSTSRHHFRVATDGTDNIFFELEDQSYRLYLAESDPPPFEKDTSELNQGDPRLAEPFRSVFIDYDHAELAFSLFHDVANALGVLDAEDERLVLSLRDDKTLPIVRLGFCTWMILDFDQKTVRLALAEAYAPKDEGIPVMEPFTASSTADPNFPILLCRIPFDVFMARSDDFMEAFEKTAPLIKQQFLNSKKSNSRHANRNEILAAVLKPSRVPDLLASSILSGKQYRTLETALESFDPAAVEEKLQKAEESRQELLERFPLAKWSTLAFEDYGLGQENPENYCRWLEFNTPLLGSIKGGSASKHLIYWSKQKQTWVFPSSYKNVEDAWTSIRNAFVEALTTLADQERWQDIDNLEALAGARVLRTKSLHIYHPDKVMPISSYDHLVFFLKSLYIWTSEMKHWETLQLNTTLFAHLRRFEPIADWSSNSLGQLLYTWNHPNEKKRIVKIAPGSDGYLWDSCLENGYICVGWDEIGDLNEFETFAEFKEAFSLVATEHYEYNQSTATKKAKELWTLKELQAGDIVIANQGISKILAVGEVTESGYQFLGDREDHKHSAGIKWDVSYQKTIEAQKRWALVTVADVPLELYQRILERPSTEGQAMTIEESFPPDETLLSIKTALERRKQVILYGPPGTGKTYHARRFAIWWLLQELENSDAKRVLGKQELFKEKETEFKSPKRKGGNVWWLVANPGQWQWDQLFEQGSEVFKEGNLRKHYPNVQIGDLVIGYQSSPDLKIMALAHVIEGLHDVEGEPHIKVAPLHKLSNAPSYSDLQNDTVLANSEPMRNNCRGTLFALNETEAQHLFKMLEERGNDLSNYVSMNNHHGLLHWVTFHPSYSYEDFVEGFRPVETGESGLSLSLEAGLFKHICQDAQTNPDRPYLLVIDEINRANLAKVFGELITLIEKDKRGLSITLPQSREAFAVPENVYILGTMNTADRSIKLMDTALRRRFAFVEVMPDVSHLAGAQIGSLALDDFLSVLNQRISKTEGREKQLGHALLMESGEVITNLSEFCQVFRQEILPLLQEYCFDDYNILAGYIGNELIDVEAQEFKRELLDDDEALVEALSKSIASDLV